MCCAATSAGRFQPETAPAATLAAMNEAKFCDQCGRSIVPLDVPHVERPCADCGKSVYVAEPGEDGRGIRVREGDRFTIPAGWLTMSLDPSKSSGRLFRPGVSWFVTQLMTGDLPSNDEDVDGYLEKLKAAADEILENSERLAHLDLENEVDAEQAIELLKQDRLAIEWWALLVGTFAAALLDDLGNGAPRASVLSAARMQAAHSMLVFKQSLEEQVWAGYKHTQLIYDIASASARTPEDAEKIQALRPLFAKLDEDVLHAWVDSDVDIGPRIGVTGLDEALLKGLAKYHLSLFERRRQEAQLEREQSSRVWSNRIAAAGVGAAIATAVIAILSAIS